MKEIDSIANFLGDFYGIGDFEGYLFHLQHGKGFTPRNDENAKIYEHAAGDRSSIGYGDCKGI
jgi:hypothetical protein